VVLRVGGRAAVGVALDPIVCHVGRPALLRIGPDDLGREVTIRCRMPDGRFADTVGELLGWADGVVTVRRRTGEVVALDEPSLYAGRLVVRREPRQPRP
jgi:hypothetical protein